MTKTQEAIAIGGMVYVTPRGERIRWARRLGRFAIGASFRWSSFGLGIDIVHAGVLVQIGPTFAFIARIEEA